MPNNRLSNRDGTRYYVVAFPLPLLGMDKSIKYNTINKYYEYGFYSYL